MVMHLCKVLQMGCLYAVPGMSHAVGSSLMASMCSWQKGSVCLARDRLQVWCRSGLLARDGHVVLHVAHPHVVDAVLLKKLT